MSVDLAPRGVSTLQLQFRRFRKNRLAMMSVAVLALIVLGCFLGPYAFPFTGEDADFDNISAPASSSGRIFSAPTISGATFWCGCWKAGRCP